MHGITTADVMAVLLPIWNSKPPTARRVRQRIGTVMKWAITQGYRMDNPAGEALGAALPKQDGIKRHFKAPPYGEVAGAVRTVRQSEAAVGVKLGFEFLVLTACRSGEMRGARWEEVDLEEDGSALPGNSPSPSAMPNSVCPRPLLAAGVGPCNGVTKSPVEAAKQARSPFKAELSFAMLGRQLARPR